MESIKRLKEVRKWLQYWIRMYKDEINEWKWHLEFWSTMTNSKRHQEMMEHHTKGLELEKYTLKAYQCALRAVNYLIRNKTPKRLPRKTYIYKKYFDAELTYLFEKNKRIPGYIKHHYETVCNYKTCLKAIKEMEKRWKVEN